MDKYWSQEVEHMQVPDGTGQVVRESERPLLACYIRRKLLCGNLSQFGKKVKFGYNDMVWLKVWSMEGVIVLVYVHASEWHLTFVKGEFHTVW